MITAVFWKTPQSHSFRQHVLSFFFVPPGWGSFLCFFLSLLIPYLFALRQSAGISWKFLQTIVPSSQSLPHTAKSEQLKLNQELPSCSELAWYHQENKNRARDISAAFPRFCQCWRPCESLSTYRQLTSDSRDTPGTQRYKDLFYRFFLMILSSSVHLSRRYLTVF